MSAATNFLRSIIDSGEVALLRRATPELFTEEETPAYEWMVRYVDRYREVPSLDIATDEGFSFPSNRRQASPQYYYDTLRSRYGYTQVNERNPQFVEAMRNQDTEGMLRILRDMTQAAASAIESQRYSTLGDEMDAVIADYREAKRSPGLRGVPTGWETADAATNGLIGGDLVVIVGRPSLGKSWMMMEMARNANEAGYSVAFTSMEMGLMQIARRWLGRTTGINPNMIRAGEVGTYAEEEMIREVERLKRMPNPVHCLAGDMRKNVSGVEGMILEFSPDIVFVDAAYLLSPAGAKKGYISRWESISEVVRELKELALRYDVPVVISVQFNRNQRNNSTKEFDLGDISGSDSIPQDASIVWGIRKGQQPFAEQQRILEFMKNREGDTPRFATNFSFYPVRFNEVPLLEEEEGEVEDLVDWME